MAVGGWSASFVFIFTLKKKRLIGKWLCYSIFPSFSVLAAQFIYSRRDKPSLVEPVEEYDYEDLKESSNSFLNHQLSGIDQGIVKSSLSVLRV